MRVTLDTNAIIDLEDSRPAAPALRVLIEMWRAGTIELCVSAIVASERFRDPDDSPNFARFEDKLRATGLEGVELLSPPGEWDLTFFDHCVFVGEADIKLIEQIRTILFPDLVVGEIPGEADDERAKRSSNNRNAMCDVYAMWCHIGYHCHMFVTRDGNFHKASRKQRLIELGAGLIVRPDEAVAFMQKDWNVN